MGDVIWAPSALKDIEQIARFIAHDSSDQAALFITSTETGADTVLSHKAP